MITSLDNERIKKIVKLKEKKHRDNEGLFIVEGEHLVTEAKEAGFLVEELRMDVDVSSNVMKKILSTESLVKVVGVCKMSNKKEITNRILLLDNVQDPGNMGTLIRSAVSFGFNTLVVNKGCVDVYNPKVVRSTQGAIFKINIINQEIMSFIESLKDYAVYGTSLVNGVGLKLIEQEDKMAIILGNEGQGINPKILEKTRNIYIEMNNMESLNVGVAGSIIMYQLSNKE